LGDVDGVVLCGDTDLGTKGAAWALRTFKKIPVLYVAGNHEYYKHESRKELYLALSGYLQLYLSYQGKTLNQ